MKESFKDGVHIGYGGRRKVGRPGQADAAAFSRKPVAAYLGVYTDPEFQTPAKDSGGRDANYELTNDELALPDGSALTKLITYALPASGFSNGDISLYAKAWAEENGQEVKQYYTGNDTGIIVFTDPTAGSRRGRCGLWPLHCGRRKKYNRFRR